MPAVSPEKRVILLIDDQEADAILIKRALERCGLKYPVLTVPGGAEAFAYLNGDPPFTDRSRYPLPLLVLLDIGMPAIDGFQVLTWIRNNSKLAGLPVVMLTGSNFAEHANKAYRLGATSFLIKSLDFANAAGLFSTVEQLIAGPH